MNLFQKTFHTDYRICHIRKRNVDRLKYFSISIPSLNKNSLDYEKLFVFFARSAKGQKEVTNTAEKIFVRLHELSESEENFSRPPPKTQGPQRPW